MPGRMEEEGGSVLFFGDNTTQKTRQQTGFFIRILGKDMFSKKKRDILYIHWNPTRETYNILLIRKRERGRD
jgi:hypothetical protein